MVLIMNNKLKSVLWGDGRIQHGLGLRTIKTAVAVMLCFMAFELYKLTADTIYIASPFYACCAAILCMQDSVHNTLRLGIARVVGTIIGGAVGLGVVSVAGYMPSWALIPISGLCVMLCISICNLLGNQSACAISGVVLFAVMARMGMGTQAPYIFAISRVIETIAGIILAALVNKYFVPPRKKSARRDTKSQHSTPTDKF